MRAEQVLEADVIHFTAPKNKMNKDIVFNRDTSFFALANINTTTKEDENIYDENLLLAIHNHI